MNTTRIKALFEVAGVKLSNEKAVKIKKILEDEFAENPNPALNDDEGPVGDDAPPEDLGDEAGDEGESEVTDAGKLIADIQDMIVDLALVADQMEVPGEEVELEQPGENDVPVENYYMESIDDPNFCEEDDLDKMLGNGSYTEEDAAHLRGKVAELEAEIEKLKKGDDEGPKFPPSADEEGFNDEPSY